MDKLKSTTAWLTASLVVALLYRLPALWNAFAGDYVVQDDARQHVFWMLRFADPALFPDDLLADYFQAAAPAGYSLIYRAGVFLGGGVWALNKGLPVVIALVTTAWGFSVTLQLLPIPLAGFVTTLFLNQTLLVRDDIDSATPAAFFYPIFLAFLHSILKKSWPACALLILLMGLFYPQGVLIMAGTLGLQLLCWRHGRPALSQKSADYQLWLAGWVAAACVLLPYAIAASPYGPVVTLAQGQEMFALSSEGWSEFFVDNPVDYWLCGKRSGLFPTEWCAIKAGSFPLLGLIWVVPFALLVAQRSRLPRAFAAGMALFGRVALASGLCFAAAHLLLFRLHLPNRYGEHSLRVVGAMSLGLAVFWGINRFRRQGRLSRTVGVGLAAWTVIPLLVAVIVTGQNLGNYTRGQSPDLYAYLQQQPKDTLVASLTEETNNLPSFAQRSIFVGAESYTLPYHLGYYAEVKQRTVDLINAQYSLEPSGVQAFLAKYPIDLWLLHENAFTPKWIQRSDWLKQYLHEASTPLRTIQAGRPAALQFASEACTVAEIDDFVVLEADCLRQALGEDSSP